MKTGKVMHMNPLPPSFVCPHSLATNRRGFLSVLVASLAASVRAADVKGREFVMNKFAASMAVVKKHLPG